MRCCPGRFMGAEFITPKGDDRHTHRGGSPVAPRQRYWRDAREGAGQLGTPVVDFPADHGGFAAVPEQFGRLLDQVLTQAR